MKGIILFFIVAFVLLGAGVFVYETQIAAPRAGIVLKKQLANPKKLKKADPVVAAPIKKPSPKIVTAFNAQTTPFKSKADTSRIIDLNSPYETEGVDLKEQEALLKSLDESIKKTIQESIRVDIQKAVATEISRQR
jgi:hypothetical protein